MKTSEKLFCFLLGAISCAVGFCFGQLRREPLPPLFFKSGVWYTDGSDEMRSRAMNGWRIGETIRMSDGEYRWSKWTNGGAIEAPDNK